LSNDTETTVFTSATYLDNKLFILGGSYNGINITNEFLYLDVSGPFNTKDLLWKDLSNDIIPPHNGAIIVVGCVNNNTLFLYGGNTNNISGSMALVYMFDPINNT